MRLNPKPEPSRFFSLPMHNKGSPSHRQSAAEFSTLFRSFNARERQLYGEIRIDDRMLLLRETDLLGEASCQRDANRAVPAARARAGASPVGQIRGAPRHGAPR